MTDHDREERLAIVAEDCGDARAEAVVSCAEALACGLIDACECGAGHRRFVTWPDPAARAPHVHAWPRGGSRFEPDAVCIGPDCPRAEHNREASDDA